MSDEILQAMRRQSRLYTCRNCQSSMGNCQMRVVYEQGNRALIEVVCTHCDDRNLLQVVIRHMAEDSPPEAETEVRLPITPDEMLDVHNWAKEYEGDFRSLFSDKAPTPRNENEGGPQTA